MHSTSNLEDGYIGSGKRLWYSINKHGKNNHKLEILEFLPNRKSLSNRESEIVNKSLLNDSLCMNLRIGGEGGSGFEHTDETKRKISEAGKLRFESEENRKKQSNSVRLAFSDPKIRDKCRTFKDKNHSEETKDKIRLAKLGKPISQEHKESIRKKLIGTHLSEETKRKMSQSIKGTNAPSKYKFWVIQSPTGEIFNVECVKDFCVKYKISMPGLQKSFNNKRPCKQGPSKGWIVLEKKKKDL